MHFPQRPARHSNVSMKYLNNMSFGMSQSCWKVSKTYDTHGSLIIEAIQVFSRIFLFTIQYHRTTTNVQCMYSSNTTIFIGRI